MVRMQRKHEQTGVMWSSEELNKEAARLSKLKLKGQPNMRISDFVFGSTLISIPTILLNWVSKEKWLRDSKEMAEHPST